MSDLNIKDFLTSGAFLQIGADLFKVLIGPFTRHDFANMAYLKHSTLLYRPNFWDFLNKSPNLSQKPIYSSAQAYILNREEFIHFLSPPMALVPTKTQPMMQSCRPEIHWEDADLTSFRTQFEWSQINFAEKQLSKTVPIIRQQGTAHFSCENLLWCMQNLINLKTFGWSYGFFENGAGIIGHTPEILAQWTRIDRQLHTVALAGTYAKNEEAFKKILSDKKVLNEHKIVIEDIVAKFSNLHLKSNFAPNYRAQYIQSPTEILELPHLLHLITELQIGIDSIAQAFDIINILHPTAAMGLYPYSREKLEEFSGFALQQERGYFAAPFAIIEKNDIEKQAIYCVVAIRNMIFTKEQVQIFSGCGVTAESQYELELTELQSKRDSVKKILGLAID